jgi:hypothetical protein
MSSLLHYNPVSRCGTNLEKMAGFDVMEKAARLFIGAGLEGEWKKSVSVQNSTLVC